MYEITTTTATVFDAADKYLEMIFETGMLDLDGLTVHLYRDSEMADPDITIVSIPDGAIVTNKVSDESITLGKTKPNTYVGDNVLAFHNELKKLNKDNCLTHAKVCKTFTTSDLSEPTLKFMKLCFVLADDEPEKSMSGLYTTVTNLSNSNKMTVAVDNDVIVVNTVIGVTTHSVSCDVPIPYEDQINLVRIFMKLENI